MEKNSHFNEVLHARQTLTDVRNSSGVRVVLCVARSLVDIRGHNAQFHQETGAFGTWGVERRVRSPGTCCLLHLELARWGFNDRSIHLTSGPCRRSKLIPTPLGTILAMPPLESRAASCSRDP